MEIYIKERDFVPPFKIFGNLYFIGTRPASAHIVDTGGGLLLFDTGYLETTEVALENLKALGFDVKDVKYVLLTHGHIDHFGGAKMVRDLSGAKTVIGSPDRQYANGELDLSYAKELGLEYNENFEPDILLCDGDRLTLGNTTVTAIATPGHTPGAMSYFFDVTDGVETYRAGLHGGMGINTLTREFLEKYSLPFTLRDDFRRSMLRLAKEKVDIFLGNHMQHNKTPEKLERLLAGDKYAFVNPGEWSPYSLWCIENLNNMIKKEIEK